MPKYQRGDVTLHYELDGSGPPAVNICGFSSHSNEIAIIRLRQFLSQSHTVLTVDNRGSGQTFVPDGASATIDDMADDIAAIMDHVGMGSAHALGISMGGCIAMTLAIRHPHKVRSQVIAVSGTHIPDGHTRGEFMLHTVQEMYERGTPPAIINRFVAIMLLGEEVFTDEAFIEAWVNAPPDPLRQTRAGFDLQMGALHAYDIRALVKNITVPTLVASSPEDILVPPRYHDEIAQLIPNAEIKRYPGGHAFMMTPVYSMQFFGDALAFWARHPTY